MCSYPRGLCVVSNGNASISLPFARVNDAIASQVASNISPSRRTGGAQLPLNYNQLLRGYID